MKYFGSLVLNPFVMSYLAHGPDLRKIMKRSLGEIATWNKDEMENQLDSIFEDVKRTQAA